MSKLIDAKRQLILDELKARTTAKWDIKNILFKQQLDFVRDPRRRKTAVCSRRSGKSVGCAVDLLDFAHNNENSTLLYVTLTRNSAKRLVWRECLGFIKKYKLPFEANNSDLTLTHSENGSVIYFSGAAYEDEIEKFRGFKLNKVYLDEVQSFKPWIKTLIDDVLSYATLDTYGEILCIGTPGPIPGGYFYDISHSEKWSNHKWTMRDNPFALDEKARKAGKTIDDVMKEEREFKGQKETDPAYLREALGMWVPDDDSLVYKYNPIVNDYDNIPNEELIYVFGIDIGYVDADAIAVLGFSQKEKKVYLVEEYLKSKQDITDLVNIIRQLEAKYKPIKMVMDAGALGKKIHEELRGRHSVNVEMAEKTRKLEFIELFNDDLKGGRVKIKRTSRAVSDYERIEWDVVSKERRTISTGFHSDIADAVLYAWRSSRHYLAREPEVIDYSFEAEEERMFEQLEKKYRDAKALEWWEK